MKTMKLAGVLMFFLGLGLFNSSYAQTTTWKFKAGDNSGYMAQITSNGEGYITKIELGKVGDAAWTATEIISITEDQDYARVKSAGSGRVYELTFYWGEDKMIMTLPEGNTVTYWLSK
jgi:hypothetical protein